MIKKENRLKKNKHFKYIYNKGTTRTLNCLSVCFAQTKIKPIKVGFSVSKKIGKSNVRNKIKRRLRESFCSLINNFNTSYNYVFVAKSGIENMTYFEIKQNMIELIKKCDLYVKNKEDSCHNQNKYSISYQYNLLFFELINQMLSKWH